MKGTTFLRSVTKKSRKYLRLDHTWSLELRVHPSVDRKRVDQYIFKFVFHFERGDLSKDSRKLRGDGGYLPKLVQTYEAIPAWSWK